ncbi:MAG: hypothetical protein H8E66_09700 [Planctomycetes bacterium]|nr:hypothetical protein [Planctomycetota bacterium]
MKKITLALAVIVGFALVGMGTSDAEAASPFGFHFGNSGFHVNIGTPHHRGHTSYYRRSNLGRHYGSSHYGRGNRGHYDYHDTTHYDYHPGQFYRHGNHIDYVPGHYDLHRSGHYDYHRGSHGYRSHR